MRIEKDLIRKFNDDVLRHIQDLADIGRRMEVDERELIPRIVQTLMQIAIQIAIECSDIDVANFLQATRKEFNYRKNK